MDFRKWYSAKLSKLSHDNCDPFESRTQSGRTSTLSKMR